MQEYDPKTLNSLLIDKMSTEEGREKFAAEGADYVRMKLREESFMRQILQPEVVTRDECQRSVNTDSLVKIVDKEPDTQAMALSNRGVGDAHYLEGPRFEIPFFQVASEKFQKTEVELLAYEMPLMEVVEGHTVFDIQKVEDTIFMDHVEAVLCDSTLAATQVVSGLSYEGTTNNFLKNHFEQGFNIIDGQELKSEYILMNNKMYNKLINFDASEFGDQLGTETFLNGYTYQTLFGRKLIVTNKKRWTAGTYMANTGRSATAAIGDDLVRDGHIYFFASKPYLGRAYTLGDTQFYVDKKRDLINFESWEHIAMGIGNVHAVGKVIIS